MTIEKQKDAWKVEGNACRQGEKYAIEEMTSPRRMVTSSVVVEQGDYEMLSVKTDRTVKKEKINAVLQAMKKVHVQAPINIGEVLIENIAQTDASLIATRKINRR
jgi:CxxC motif-containing protein